ncbi:rhomboid family intramembrane serine protease [Curtobacterium sp. MCLR17_007]|uniref:rhomboid family intramembrane serine protease n=1 Tax=Curtobacterium sp. MCLR17_007 TaxID=2175648 RepID=UPI000DA7C584|nr:rhomboid family intramembrane serine protease [Curtobacterium sp. MCLR17_007]WIB59777.1 rhomboid family intramembrane serine protease [Curtobacterium sp. MCLR17_007]
MAPSVRQRLAAQSSRTALVVTIVTAAVSVAAVVHPSLTAVMIRDGELVRAGQWWRLVTSILVQPDGWGQFAFNLLGIAVVGSALEQRRSERVWLLTYLVAGVGSGLVLALLLPEQRDGGASDCVAGLIGALVVVRVLDRTTPTGPGGLRDTVAVAYSAFFCAYLTLLDLGGVWPAIVAGDAAVAVALTASHRFGAVRTAFGLLVLVAVAGGVMTARIDGHGIGLLTGALLAVTIARTQPRRPTTAAVT